VQFLRRRRRHRPKRAEHRFVDDDELERSDEHDDHAKLVRSNKLHVVRSDRHDHKRDHDHRRGHRHRPEHHHDHNHDQDDGNDHDKDFDGSDEHDHHAGRLRSVRHAPFDELVRYGRHDHRHDVDLDGSDEHDPRAEPVRSDGPGRLVGRERGDR
jgi:hypothetical protein